MPLPALWPHALCAVPREDIPETAIELDPASLYVWDARLSKALLEDISHVEVLLRNRYSHQKHLVMGDPAE